MADPGLHDEMTALYHIPDGEYHSDDSDNVEYPYRLTRRTRLTGWGADGITFINTGRGRDLGAALLALNTTGSDSIIVSWTAGTILPNSREYAIRLQYRVGAYGAFSDVTDNAGEVVEYVRHDTERHFQFMEPVLLPEEVNNKRYVQLRWKYYHVSGTGGPRAELLLDNILVTAGKHPHTLFPEPYDLSQGTYEFHSWDPNQPEGTFPTNMIFLQTRMDDPGIHDGMVEPYHIPFYHEDNNEYHGNDQDKFGYPYMLTGRSRINGLGEGGVSFINTGRGRDVGATVIALNTTNRKVITVTWSGGTLVPNSRIYTIRLRYRVGTSGPFKDVLENGMPVEYKRRAVFDYDEVIGPVTFPQEVEDMPYVQIKWKYYYTGEQIDPDVGRRDMLRLGNITVASRPADHDKVPERPLLVSPENNSIGVSISPRFIWQKSQNTTSYNIQLTDNGGFDIDVDEITDTTYQVSGLAPETVYGWRVRSWNSNGYSDWSETYGFTTAGEPSVLEGLGTPEKYELFQNYPNPFNRSTVIRYGIPERSHVSLTVFNSLGQKITELVNEEREAFFYEITFDASHLPSGIYIYRLQAGAYVESKRMLYLK